MPLTLPKPLLRKGANLLAIEIRASHIHPVVLTGREANWGRAFQREMFWSHCRLLDLELRSTAATAPSALVRPPGVQVWAEDVHRVCYGDDFGPAGPPGTVRFVGAANGTYCAQIVVGADRELTGLRMLPSALRASQGGAELPASAMRVGYLVGHPAAQLVQLGQIRNMVEDRADPLCPPAEMAVVRYGMGEARAGRLPRAQRLQAAEKLRFFDHIGASAPDRVAAGACQPVWLSLTIPPDAAAGTYRGSVEIGAEGIEPIRVPVEAEAVGWRMPDPPDFQIVVALEQSPYGVAKHYGVPLWSEEHFRRLEGSFRQLARVGDRLLFIPCIQNTEFGNFGDTMVRWLRRNDGSLAFDFRVLDRYLGLAGQHLRRLPLLCFVVMHGVDRWGPGDKLATSVTITEEATGKTGLLDLSNDAPGSRESWKAFAAGLATHLRAKGLERSALWGLCWDNPGDPMLAPLLAEAAPEFAWARSSHTGEPNATFPRGDHVPGARAHRDQPEGLEQPVPRTALPALGPNPQIEAGGAKADRATMHAAPEQVTLYSIEGAGFRAFSARVRILPAYARPSYGLLHQVRVNFEVYADGQLRVQSGLMAPADDARLLVADGLDGARELKLVTRYDRPEPRNAGRIVYAEWQEAKCYK